MESVVPHTEDVRVSVKLASTIAEYLDQANIPNALFGWLAVLLAGSDEVINEVDFVIPDAHMQAAVDTLVSNGYSLCSNPTCNEMQIDRLGNVPISHQEADPYLVMGKNRYHAIPAAHFHFDPDGQYGLALHTQSSTLWWLPDLKAGAPTADDPVFWLSNDPRFPPAEVGGSGPWPSIYHPVKVPNPDSLVEALMYLYCRDSALARVLKTCWKLMFLYIRDGGPRPKPLKHLRRGDFQEAWDTLNERLPREKNIYERLFRLRNSLAEDNELGPMVDPNNYRKPDEERVPIEGLRQD